MLKKITGAAPWVLLAAMTVANGLLLSRNLGMRRALGLDFARR